MAFKKLSNVIQQFFQGINRSVILIKTTLPLTTFDAIETS